MKKLTRRSLEALTGALLVVTSCEKKPNPADTLSSVASELATASIAGEAWVLHRTSNSFTSNTLRDARMSIADQQNVLFTDAVPPVDTALLRTTLDHAKDMLATMEKLIAQQDARSFRTALTFFEQDANKVKDMSDSLEKRE